LFDIYIDVIIYVFEARELKWRRNRKGIERKWRKRIEGSGMKPDTNWVN
jgi:hypothetical protein